MKKYKNLKIEGAILNEKQLEEYLKKISLQHNIGKKSDKLTYPIPQLLENYNIIKIVYNLLNEHIKLGITINPAGEWILDNFYIIEEVIQQIEKELTMKKYVNFVGIQNGQYAGFARIHVLASEIVAYTDNIIRSESLEKYLTSYQNKRALNMDEIWNIGIFLQIAIIQNITDICIKIYNSQVQKYKVKNIIERFFGPDYSSDFLDALIEVNRVRIAEELGGINSFQMLTLCTEITVPCIISLN